MENDMYELRQKYIDKINNSRLFEYEPDSPAYRKESYHMVENLFEYLMTFKNKNYEEYGCEINEVATRCIKNYNPEKGPFLYYFNAAWKLEYQHIKGKESFEVAYGGMRITESERKLITRLRKWKADNRNNETVEKQILLISEAMDLPPEKVQQLWILDSNRLKDTIVKNDDREEENLLGSTRAEMGIDELLLQQSGVEALLEQFDEEFRKLQERQKPLISDVFTARILSKMDVAEQTLQRFSILSEEVIRKYEHTGEIPKQRDIAEKHGRDEASISRSVKIFLENCRQKI